MDAALEAIRGKLSEAKNLTEQISALPLEQVRVALVDEHKALRETLAEIDAEATKRHDALLTRLDRLITTIETVRPYFAGILAEVERNVGLINTSVDGNVFDQ